MQTHETSDQARGISKLLGRQQRRIRRRFLIHGLGWALGTAVAIVVVYYLADRSLRLPGAVRVLVSTAALLYVLYVLRRRLLYPLARRFTRSDVATVLERRFPELRQKLVSAFDLQKHLDKDAALPDPDAEKLRNQSPDMIRLVVAEAAAESRTLPVQQILDPRRTFRVWGLAFCFFLIASSGAVANPEACGVFLQRALGLSVSYPRRTELQVELPPTSPELRKRVFAEEGIAEVTLARGADLIVTVFARRGNPREVLLHTSGVRGGDGEVAMTPRGNRRFRFVFRRVDNDFEFFASGDDDDRGDLKVSVNIISPPEVADIRATLHQPAYTGALEATQAGGGIEALQGTRVELSVTATAEVETANLTFLTSGESIELEKQEIADDSGVETAYTGTFYVTQSDRYRIELVGTNGLRNPRPGSYTLTALQDYVPVGRMLTPPDDLYGVVLPKGLVPIRVFARDDFGLTSAEVNVSFGRSPEDRVLDLAPAETPLAAETVLTRLMEVVELPPDGALISVGETIGLTTVLTDNREPEHQTNTLPSRQIHLVEEADLLRRIAGHFRRIRDEVLGAQGRQQDGLDRVQGLIEELEAGLEPERMRIILLAVDMGQARISGTSERIHQEFMRSFNLHLFNRQEPSVHADEVVELYLRWHQANPVEMEFAPEFYAMLDRERRESRLGAMETKLDPILAMIMSAERLKTELAPQATRLIKTAQIAESENEGIAALGEAAGVQEQILAELQALLDQLDEWNEFQDVINETRALRDKQQDVQVRTQGIRGKEPENKEPEDKDKVKDQDR